MFRNSGKTAHTHAVTGFGPRLGVAELIRAPGTKHAPLEFAALKPRPIVCSCARMLRFPASTKILIISEQLLATLGNCEIFNDSAQLRNRCTRLAIIEVTESYLKVT